MLLLLGNNFNKSALLNLFAHLLKFQRYLYINNRLLPNSQNGENLHCGGLVNLR